MEEIEDGEIIESTNVSNKEAYSDNPLRDSRSKALNMEGGFNGSDKVVKLSEVSNDGNDKNGGEDSKIREGVIVSKDHLEKTGDMSS